MLSRDLFPQISTSEVTVTSLREERRTRLNLVQSSREIQIGSWICITEATTDYNTHSRTMEAGNLEANSWFKRPQALYAAKGSGGAR